jgi:hypothetical protein
LIGRQVGQFLNASPTSGTSTLTFTGTTMVHGNLIWNGTVTFGSVLGIGSVPPIFAAPPPSTDGTFGGDFVSSSNPAATLLGGFISTLVGGQDGAPVQEVDNFGLDASALVVDTIPKLTPSGSQ